MNNSPKRIEARRLMHAGIWQLASGISPCCTHSAKNSSSSNFLYHCTKLKHIEKLLQIDRKQKSSSKYIHTRDFCRIHVVFFKTFLLNILFKILYY